jgi:predicted MFS family arabinose efflux permease
MPAGAWLGLHFGWRATFWAMTAIGLLSFVVIAVMVKNSRTHEAPVRLLTNEDHRSPSGTAGIADDGAAVDGDVCRDHLCAAAADACQRLRRSAVSPILLLFGGGMIIGNVLGGRMADRRPRGAARRAGDADGGAGHDDAVAAQPVAVVVFVGVLGIAAFSTVSPLQLRVLRHARGPARTSRRASISPRSIWAMGWARGWADWWSTMVWALRRRPGWRRWPGWRHWPLHSTQFVRSATVPRRMLHIISIQFDRRQRDDCRSS